MRQEAEEAVLASGCLPLFGKQALFGMPRRTERRFASWPAVCGCEAQGFVRFLRISSHMLSLCSFYGRLHV